MEMERGGGGKATALVETPTRQRRCYRALRCRHGCNGPLTRASRGTVSPPHAPTTPNPSRRPSPRSLPWYRLLRSRCRFLPPSAHPLLHPHVALLLPAAVPRHWHAQNCPRTTSPNPLPRVGAPTGDGHGTTVPQCKKGLRGIIQPLPHPPHPHAHPQPRSRGPGVHRVQLSSSVHRPRGPWNREHTPHATPGRMPGNAPHDGCGTW